METMTFTEILLRYTENISNTNTPENSITFDSLFIPSNILSNKNVLFINKLTIAIILRKSY